MIFGFNSDVKVGDVVYNVQSEAREKELVLQTQVFVKGQCVGKCAASYADIAGQPEVSSDEMQQRLKAQHRRIVESVRAGAFAEEWPAQNSPPPAFESVSKNGAIPRASTLAAFPEAPSSGPFSIECLNAGAVLRDGAVVLVLEVRRDLQPLPGAELTLRFVWGNEHSHYFYATTNADGTAELTMAVSSAGDEGRVLVQASLEDVSATRRFRLHPAD